MPIRKALIVTLIFCCSSLLVHAQKSFNVASGDWNVGGNWSPVGVPGIGDAVTIPAGRTVTIVGAGNECASISFTAGTSSSGITFASGASLTVTGAITMTDPTATPVTQEISVGDGTLTCGSLTMANTSATTEKNRLSISTGTVTITGNFAVNGGAVGENELVFSSSGRLVVGGTFGLGTNDTFTPSTGTIELNGSGAQSISGANTFNRLIISNTGTKTISAAIIATRLICRDGGTKSIRGTITDLEIENGSTADVVNNLTVNDSIIINGTLTHTLTTGTKLYIGVVYISPTGSWTNTGNEAFTLRGGIRNEGSFSSGTGTYTFNTNSQELRSTSALIFAGAVTISSPTIITNFDSVSIVGTITIATGGGWTNAANSKLRLAGATTLNASTLNFSAVPNTLHFARNGAQNTLAGQTIYFLYKNGGNTLTLANATITNRILVEVGSTVSCGTSTIDVNGNLNGDGTISQSSGTINLSGENLHVGTFTAGTGTFSYDGADQSVRGVTYNNLTINGSGIKTLAGATGVNGALALTAGTLSIGANTLTITGTVSGTQGIRGSSSSDLVINGTAATPTINMDQTSSATRTLQNLTMSRTTGATLGNALEVVGTVSISNGSLASGGNLTMISTNTINSRIAAISTGSITGDIVVQRFIPGGANKRKWRFLSAPVNTSGNIAYSQLIDDVTVTGVGGSANGFDDCSWCAPSLRYYTESTSGASTTGWTNPTNISNTINTGFAFELFVRGDRVQPDPFLLNTIPNDVTIDYIGSINTGAISCNLTLTDNGEVNADGLNLVGNPYPSQIDWQSGSITKTNIDNKFWTYSAVLAGYGLWDGDLNSGTNSVTNIIPVGQGFFVKANSSGASIAFAENAKSSGTAFNYFRSTASHEKPLIKLQASNADQQDELIMAFDSTASFLSGDKNDGLKFFSDRLNFYSKSANQINLAINAIPLPTSITQSDTVRLSLFTRNDSDIQYGAHQIKVIERRNLPASLEIWLIDQIDNNQVNLSADSNYSFVITSEPGSFGNDRFKLVFKMNTVGIHKSITKSSVLAYPNPAGKTLNIVLTNAEQTFEHIEIWSLEGKLLYQEPANFIDGKCMLDLQGFSAGCYQIRLLGNEHSESIRIVHLPELQ